MHDNRLTPQTAAHIMNMQEQLLQALVDLQKALHAHPAWTKMSAKKDFSLLVADAQASKAIAGAKSYVVEQA